MTDLLPAATAVLDSAPAPLAAPAPPRPRRRPGLAGTLRHIAWPLAALCALLLFDAVSTPGFFSLCVVHGHLVGPLVDVLKQGAPVMLVALGMALVIATGGVDLSVGAVAAIVGAVAAALLAHGWGAAGAIALALALGLGLGLANGTLVAAWGIQPIVATLILMVAGRGVAQLVSGGQITAIDDARFNALGGGFLLGLPVPVLLVGAATAAMAVATRRTALGLFIEASGNNPVASAYAGVDVRLVKLAVYALCGLCAALSGVLVAANIHCADSNNAGMSFELDAIMAVVIGGTPLTGGRFQLLGTLVGALLIQTLTTTILARGVPTEYTLILKALMVLAVCVLSSDRVRAALTRRKGGA